VPWRKPGRQVRELGIYGKGAPSSQVPNKRTSICEPPWSVTLFPLHNLSVTVWTSRMHHGPRLRPFFATEYSHPTLSRSGSRLRASSRTSTACLERQCAPNLPDFIQNIPHIGRRILFMSCAWITYCSHFHPIQDSSRTVLERDQVENAAAGVPTARRYPPVSIKELVARCQARKDGRVTRIGVRCEPGSASTPIHLHPGKGA
jgi:hypothetical protein